jgi:hypothetical protein
MLRATVLAIGVALLATGAILCRVGVRVPGIESLVFGAVVVRGLVFERWRYQNKNAAQDGDWEPTCERFVDPETGRNVRVLYNPHNGERRYETSADDYAKPD